MQIVVRWTITFHPVLLISKHMKSIGYFLDEVEATDEDHEEYKRGLIMKY